VICALALCSLVSLALATGASANHGLADLVSLGQINGNGPFDVAPIASPSADGSRIVFQTNERLVSADTDSAVDLYERSGGTTTLVSVGEINGNGAFDANFNLASADGTRVFFTTNEQLTSNDTNSIIDIYERSGGTTTLVSVGSIVGTGTCGCDGALSASADGTRVFFASTDQLAAADTDSELDIYERSAGTTTLVTAGQINGNGAFPVALDGTSTDGTRAFFSTREQLVSTDTDGTLDLYERSSGATTIVSAGQINGNGLFDVGGVGNNDDGTRAFFVTHEQLVSADTDSAVDLYERFGGTTTLVSAGQINGNGAFDVEAAGNNGDGTRVFFRTKEPLVSADTDSAFDLYERSGGTTTLVSAGQINGNGANDVTFGGQALDGATVFFRTTEQLVSADMDSSLDIYQRSGGVTTLVSAGQTGGNGPFDVGIFFIPSADGSRVFFRTQEQLVSADTDNALDLYERFGGATTLISRGQRGGNGAFDVTFLGSTVAGTAPLFTTSEPLACGDTDSSRDNYVARVGSGPAASTCQAGGEPPPGPAAPARECSDGRDNDGDQATDRADPGCLSGPGGAYNSADNSEADEDLRDLVLCGRRDISLVRADPRGRRVTVSGLASARLQGANIGIYGRYGRKFERLATVKAKADGSFQTSVKGPSKRQFTKARLQARAGKTRSVQLKLPQSLASSSIKAGGGTITLRGKVQRSLVGKRDKVTIKRLLCGRLQTVGSARPSRSGTYTVRFKAPALATAALYRAEARVLSRPRSKRYVKAFARAIGIRLTGQTG
jgi:hypothetical protein